MYVIRHICVEYLDSRIQPRIQRHHHFQVIIKPGRASRFLVLTYILRVMNADYERAVVWRLEAVVEQCARVQNYSILFARAKLRHLYHIVGSGGIMNHDSLARR